MRRRGGGVGEEDGKCGSGEIRGEERAAEEEEEKKKWWRKRRE